MSHKQFGLVGRNISYSFSKSYFTERFQKDNTQDCTYENFDIQEITDFPSILKNNPDLVGLNVTIPYKETVIPFLNELSETAAKIGAVNVIKITKERKLIGHNSDCYGFKKALEPLLEPHHKKALILGTGGASKAVAFALEELGISSAFVSRKASEKQISYDQIDASTFENYHIIINSTPLGTSPNTEAFPKIPYEYFTPKHIAFDLIYNPAETQFLKKAKANGAVIKNGLEMLVNQAEKAWEIWNES
ncbi:shikimate dehydrogenase family protein [Flavobacterium luteum]|uniref:Shikimate dehydrogenase n=1 Tax=Flavobacterium luteum TaxID=2026654 RepID=A0A7J5AB17_9FLAO|nr:shikimate dehydrogenase [Flavobacterium luteum]KAB1154740.1 shikimate dehydrogenase [Flavobacterium luteum]